MTYETRKLNPNDINLAKELFLFFQIDDGVVNPTLGSDEYLRDLLSRNDFHVIVALQNETIIGGLVGYELAKYKEETTVMFLYEIGVRLSFRRKGIATKMIDCLKEICGEKAVSKVFVVTERDNKPAKKLYEATDGIEDQNVICFNYKID